MAEINETIRKTGSTWTVYSEKGKRLGSYRSRGGAKKRLRQIEYFKHVNEAMPSHLREPKFNKTWISPDGQTFDSGKDHGTFMSNRYKTNNVTVAFTSAINEGWVRVTKVMRGDGTIDYDIYGEDENNVQRALRMLKAELIRSDNVYVDFGGKSFRFKPRYDRTGLAKFINDMESGQQIVIESSHPIHLKWSDTEIYDAAAQVGIDLEPYDIDEVKIGMAEEMEHGSENGQDTNLTHDLLVPTLQITIAHLKENPRYYTEMLFPAMGEEIPTFESHMPMFEDFLNTNDMPPQPVSNTMGNTGAFSGVEGGELVEYPHEKFEPLSAEGEARMHMFYDKIHSMTPPFGNVTDFYRNGETAAIGFSGPVISKGPLSGAESWWTLVYDVPTDKFVLIHDTAGEQYDVADAEQFGDMLSTFAKELFA